MGKQPPKLSLPRADYTARFLGPTRVHNPNDISIGSVVFAGLTVVTNRETDKHTDRQTTLQLLQQYTG